MLQNQFFFHDNKSFIMYLIVQVHGVIIGCYNVLRTSLTGPWCYNGVITLSVPHRKGPWCYNGVKLSSVPHCTGP